MSEGSLPYDTGDAVTDCGLGLHHVQLAIPPGTEDKARSFYVDVLGMTEVQKPSVLAARGPVDSGGRAGDPSRRANEFRPARKANPGILVTALRLIVLRGS